MTKQENTKADKNRRAEEAANILRRLDEDPSDTVALADKRAFLARGDAERRTYTLAERAFSAARKGIRLKDRQNKRYGFALLGAALVSLCLGWQPLSVALRADFRSGLTTESTVLKSGDTLILDASSAIADASDATTRSVDLLRGAGFFDVNRDGRSFVVTAGNVEVEVIGTAFEVSRLAGDVRVAVAEGVVQVRQGSEIITLTAGEQVLITDGQLVQSNVDIPDVARWRAAELTLTGLSLADAVAEVDRRLPGRVVILGQSLRNTQVGGVLDLNTPEIALEALATTVSAQVLRTSPFLTIVYPR
ncbi:MAG: FecR domain-containing protein [Pseudomonadota bacterium]